MPRFRASLSLPSAPETAWFAFRGSDLLVLLAAGTHNLLRAHGKSGLLSAIPLHKFSRHRQLWV